MGKIEQFRSIIFLEDNQLLEIFLPNQKSFYYPNFTLNEVANDQLYIIEINKNFFNNKIR